MIKSMTGFGRGETSLDGMLMMAEVRTVNSKYADVSVRLPRQLSYLEPAAVQIAKAAVGRGKISVTISWQADDGGESEVQRSVSPDVELARAYHEAATLVSGVLGLDAELSLDALMRMPDVMAVRENLIKPETADELLKQALGQALTDLEAMRIAEGDALAADFQERLGALEATGLEVEERAPERVTEAHEKLLARIDELVDKAAVDPQRIAMEVAVLADRLDITEECVRFRSHLAQFRSLMEGDEAPGRKLNFLLQEIGREVNTMGSKANDPAMSHFVVQMKEDLEKLREQVQNVE